MKFSIQSRYTKKRPLLALLLNRPFIVVVDGEYSERKVHDTKQKAHTLTQTLDSVRTKSKKRNNI